jgi:hypothetical protein
VSYAHWPFCFSGLESDFDRSGDRVGDGAAVQFGPVAEACLPHVRESSGKVGTWNHRAVRRRSAFPTTDTEDRLIAKAANIGLSSRPNTGYSTPAAIGTPSAL